MPIKIKSKFVGQVQFSQSLNTVWRFLTSPQLASECTPGLTEWREISPRSEFHLSFLWETPAKTKLNFPTKLTWETLSPPEKLCFSAVTDPKTFGRIHLDGEMALIENKEAETTLEFTAVVQTTNPFINQLIKNVLPRQIDQFFKCVKSKLNAQI
ncbi:MAG: SRPBCC domain-containing protein [Chloroflexota bacterium]